MRTEQELKVTRILVGFVIEFGLKKKKGVFFHGD
jgi:hypothetical protein